MRLSIKLFSFGAFASLAILLATGCTNDENLAPQDNASIEERSLISGPVSVPLIGLTPQNELVHLLSGPPVVEKGVVPISGLLRPEEWIAAIDYKALSRELYGVSNQSIIYKINPTSGVATPVTGFTFDPPISGNMVAFDIDPVEDVIRLITSSGQNLRISPITGGVLSVDSTLNPGTPAIQSIAYSYATKFSKAALYDIDSTEQALFVQNPAVGGRLEKVGPLGFTFEGEGGFEITNKNMAFAVQYGRNLFGGGNAGSTQHDVVTEDAYRLLSINLNYGGAISLGRVRPLIGLAAR